MEHISFVLFFMLYPISITINEYFNEKKRILRNEPKKEYSRDAMALEFFINFFIWLRCL